MYHLSRPLTSPDYFLGVSQTKLLSKTFKNYCFMLVEVLYVYALRKPEKDAESLGDSDGCELLYMSYESIPGRLEEQST